MQFEPVAKGYYLEGLSVDVDVVWFSDAIKGGIRRLLPDGNLKEWFPGRQWIGAIKLNGNGFILNSGRGGITWLDAATGVSGMLLDTIDGKPINGINEMMPDGKGGLYFGTLDVTAIERGEVPGSVALYRLDKDGRVTQLCNGLKFSNGIGISLDGKRLYHNETFVGTFAYDIAPDGSLGKPMMMLEKPDCDGLAIDAEGKIWIAGFRSDAIICLRPDGTPQRRIELPAVAATNICFGGIDGRDLYVTTVPADAGDGIAQGKLPDTEASILYRARSDVAGQPIPPAGFRLV